MLIFMLNERKSEKAMAAVVFSVSAGWLECMWLLCVSRVAGVHVVIVCQPGGWSTCGY